MKRLLIPIFLVIFCETANGLFFPGFHDCGIASPIFPDKAVLPYSPVANQNATFSVWVANEWSESVFLSRAVIGFGTDVQVIVEPNITLNRGDLHVIEAVVPLPESRPMPWTVNFDLEDADRNEIGCVDVSIKI